MWKIICNAKFLPDRRKFIYRQEKSDLNCKYYTRYYLDKTTQECRIETDGISHVFIFSPEINNVCVTVSSFQATQNSKQLKLLKITIENPIMVV